MTGETEGRNAFRGDDRRIGDVRARGHRTPRTPIFGIMLCGRSMDDGRLRNLKTSGEFIASRRGGTRVGKIERPSVESLIMDFAMSLTRRATCKRAQFSYVITSEDMPRV